MNKTTRIVSWLWICALCGCTSVSEIRTRHDSGGAIPLIDADHPSNGCDSKGLTDPTRAYSIEDYKDFWAGYVEFDDVGWPYASKGQPSQMEVLQTRLKRELNDPAMAETDFLIVAFVHGWHHNAHDNDCNVHEFRAMLKVANDRYAAAFGHPLKHRRRIVGVYVGWRGESIDLAGLNVTTVVDRRNAAERVAKGNVRELFALIRKLQIGESQKEKGARPDRMRTVVIGHSFGGLIAFHGLSPAVLNELTLTKPGSGDEGCKPTVSRASSILAKRSDPGSGAPELATERKNPPVFPDLLVLINPAFEATRFEALHDLTRPEDGCSYREDVPKVVVVTADNDWATGPVFTAGRRVSTALEAYPPEDDSGTAAKEHDANIHAIGFTQRYVTHRLCLRPNDGASGERHAAAALTPPEKPDWKLDAFAPVWVLRAPPEIVDGHNGFLFAKPDLSQTKQPPYLLNWLINLHTFGPAPGSLAMTADNGCGPQP